MPREGRDQIRSEITRQIAFPQEMHEAFEQAREKNDNPVKCRLEQDRLDQRRPVVASQSGILLATSTDLPTTRAAIVASMKLLTATRYCATRRFVVSTIKLKPIKKKSVGGNASRASCNSRAPIPRAIPAAFPIASAVGLLPS
jgi:hypothetical protein